MADKLYNDRSEKDLRDRKAIKGTLTAGGRGYQIETTTSTIFRARSW
jgi:hypothetical protein